MTAQPGSLDSTPEALNAWQAERASQEAAAMAGALVAGEEVPAPRVAIAMAGGLAPSDGRWQAANVAPIVGRRRATPAEPPPPGASLARRASGILGSAEDWAARIPQLLHEAGEACCPLGESLDAGAHRIWKVADASCPGVRQTRNASPLSAPLSTLAHLRAPPNPTGATAGLEQHMGARRTARVDEGLRARTRRRPWQPASGDALTPLLGSGARHQSRIRYQAPWPWGLAVGSGAGACTQVSHSRFQRADRRWQ